MEPDKIGLAEKTGDVLLTQRILAMSYTRALNRQAKETPNTAKWLAYQPTIEAHLYVLNQLETVLRDALNHYASYIASLSRAGIEQLIIRQNIPDNEKPIEVVLPGPADVPASTWTISSTDVANWIIAELVTLQEETQEASNGTE